MDLIKKANSLGYKHYTEFTIDELSKLSLNNPNKQIEYYFIQKWLREKHNKYVQCHPVYRDEKIQWEYIIFFLDEPLLSGTDGFKNRMSLLNHPYYWETYEEALEAGLYDTLKLINNDSKTEQ